MVQKSTQNQINSPVSAAGRFIKGIDIDISGSTVAGSSKATSSVTSVSSTSAMKTADGVAMVLGATNAEEDPMMDANAMVESFILFSVVVDENRF